MFMIYNYVIVNVEFILDFIRIIKLYAYVMWKIFYMCKLCFNPNCIGVFPNSIPFQIKRVTRWWHSLGRSCTICRSMKKESKLKRETWFQHKRLRVIKRRLWPFEVVILRIDVYELKIKYATFSLNRTTCRTMILISMRQLHVTFGNSVLLLVRPACLLGSET